MKQTLAITTKVPTFASPLHVGRPNLGDRNALLARITDILDRRWLSNDGPLVKEFEQRIAEYVGVKHCIAMCNATVALEIAIRALDLRGEVIVPSYTFIATAHVLQWQGITPVFADMDPQTHNIDPECIEWLITPHTTGIIGVHVWGRACDTEAIEAVGREHGLKVMYDAAHAFGCSHRGQMIGGFGACEVFSFHATKFLNSFEGGALVTNDDVLTDKSRLMRNFGFAGYDRVIYLGINGKMTEVCAAMGLTSLEGIDELIATNRKNYEAYRKGLADLVGLRVIDYDPEERSNYQYIVVEINPDRAPLNRDELIDVLHAENVLARKYFSLQANAPLLLPQTERIADRVLVLPTGMSITCEDIERVCAIIRTAAEHREEVRNALRGR